MASNKELKRKAIATVDAAITILNKYPQLKNTDSDASYNLSTNPFELLLELFKHTEGYNVLIKIIAGFIGWMLPALEIAVKGILLEYLRDFVSCTLNPIITDEILRRGVVVDLRDIDITNKLMESPLSKVGKYYYFGCDDFTTVNEVKKSKDFDCLLWYMKNKASHREVWGKKEGVDTWQKSKKQGVVTLEYHERSSGLCDAEGHGMNLQTPFNNCLHVFIGNAEEISSDEQYTIETMEKEIDNLTEFQSEINKYITKANEYLETVEQQLINLDEEYKQGKKKLTYEYERYYYENKRTALNTVTSLFIADGKGELDEQCYNIDSYDGLKDLWSTIVELQGDYLEEIMDTNFNIHKWSFSDITPETICDVASYADMIYWAQANISRTQIELYDVAHSNEDRQYRTIKQNYYYRHTLLEFNYNYVASLKLFDSKVVAAQLIDALMGLLAVDLHLDIRRQVIKDEVTKMVQMVVESDDTVVSDCFFSFSNEEYDAMLNKAEMTKAGLYSSNGTYTTIEIDAESLLESLNGISDNATEEEVVNIVEGSLTEICNTLTETTEATKTSVNVSYDSGMKTKVENIIEDTKETKGWDLFDRILTELADVLAMAIISPKIYLLLKVNLEIAGQNTNGPMTGFIDNYKQMLVNTIREVRDQLLNYLMKELLKILGTLSAEIGARIKSEQAAYFMTLMRLLLACFKKHKNNIDWNQDQVNYADIYSIETEEDNESPNAEC